MFNLGIAYGAQVGIKHRPSLAIQSLVKCSDYFCTGIGRMSNSAYKVFEAELRQVNNRQLPNTTLRKYDFSFTHWPVDFSRKNSK